MQDLFTNTFPLDGKIKLSVAGVSENGKKKRWFPLVRKAIRNKGIFQKLDFYYQKKNVQIKDTVSSRQKIGFH